MMIHEKSLLGAVLYDPAAYGTVSHLKPADFETAGYALIWEAITAVATQGLPIDPATVSAALTTAGTVERAGGAQAVVDLTTAEFLPGCAPVYAQLVTERAARRRLGDAGRWLAAEASDTQVPAVVIDRAIQGLTEIRDSLAQRTVGPGRTYQQLLDLQFDQQWVSPDLFAPGDRLILTGREGMGKSTLMRQIAVSVAAGLNPFTHVSVPSKRVMVIDCENSDVLNQAKYRPLIVRATHARGGASIPHDQLIIESRVDGLDLASQRDAAWLLSIVAENQPDLLIIGPIYKLHIGDPADEVPARKVIAALDRVRSTGVALAMEAHSPHGEDMVRPFGASIWLRWPEFGYGLRRKTRDEYELVAWRGPRDARAFPEILSRGGSWPWRDARVADWHAAPPEDLANRAWPSVPPPAAGGYR